MKNQPDGVIYVSPNDPEPTPEQTALIGHGRTRLSDFLGTPDPSDLSVGLPNRKVNGPCRVCGTTAPLTFEHMPPQSSGNKFRRRTLDQPTALARASLEFPERGWKQQQRGVGAYVTCGDCNNFGGREYVGAYSDFTASVVIGLSDAIDADVAATTEEPDLGRIKMEMQHVFPGDIIRQVFFMLMAVSGTAGFSRRFPEIRDMVLNGTSIELPEHMRVLLTLVGSRRARLGMAQAEITVDPPGERVLVEVASIPFAWLLEYGDPSDRSAADVSHWTQIAPGTEQDLTIETNTGYVNTAVPGDYRSAQDVFPTAAANSDDE